MNKNSRLEAVEHFYDFHPISAQQIFESIAARGIAKEDITEEVLQLHDQDHYGGTQAVTALVRFTVVFTTTNHSSVPISVK